MSPSLTLTCSMRSVQASEKSSHGIVRGRKGATEGGSMRLKDKGAIIIGAGQSEGSTAAVGNGRATALVFAREGAKVLVVDRDLTSAAETVALIAQKGGEATAGREDVMDEQRIKAAIDTCMQHWGRLDILHNNVGISVAGKDAAVEDI